MCLAVLLPSALVMTTGLAQLAFDVIGSAGGSGFDAVGQAVGQAPVALLLSFILTMTWLVGLVVFMFRRVSVARWLMAVTLVGIAGIAVSYALIDRQEYVLHQPISGPIRPDYHSPHVPNELLAVVDVGLALLLVSPLVARDLTRRRPKPPAPA